eukprot:3078555-Rhodomonas_salina.1
MQSLRPVRYCPTPCPVLPMQSLRPVRYCPTPSPVLRREPLLSGVFAHGAAPGGPRGVAAAGGVGGAKKTDAGDPRP